MLASHRCLSQQWARKDVQKISRVLPWPLPRVTPGIKPAASAPTNPTQQTCGMKHYQKHPRRSPQHFQTLAFCCPSLAVGSAGLWECRGWHEPLRVLPAPGNPAPPFPQCGTTQKQEPTPCDTALTRKPLRELLVSHQPSLPDPTRLCGDVSPAAISDGRFSPTCVSLPSLLFSSPTTGREDGRVSWLIHITAASTMCG